MKFVSPAPTAPVRPDTHPGTRGMKSGARRVKSTAVATLAGRFEIAQWVNAG